MAGDAFADATDPCHALIFAVCLVANFPMTIFFLTSKYTEPRALVANDTEPRAVAATFCCTTTAPFGLLLPPQLLPASAADTDP